jgi:poly-gamma-glutamate synthesis protein (capsule biosynthesis protein)
LTVLRGIIASLILSGLASLIGIADGGGRARQAVSPDTSTAAGAGGAQRIRLLALGDVNLGRRVGQILLQGDTLHPFRWVADTLAAYDLVFANLESPLSDQGGETESPRSNYIFTGPPVGARSLQRAGVSVVSSANNHILDYGPSGAAETRRYLEEAGVACAGSSDDGGNPYRAVVLDRRGIRLAFIAVTAVMNGRRESWRRYVAADDTLRLRQAIAAVRDSVDLVVVSYHGGTEYAATVDPGTVAFCAAAARAGAGLILGHHPHVPYGLRREEGAVIAHSLGNFVFLQPGRFWTRRGIALAVTIVKQEGRTAIEAVRILPVAAGFQPRFVVSGPEADTVRARTAALSTNVHVE